jgi:hypothetical protein
MFHYCSGLQRKALLCEQRYFTEVMKTLNMFQHSDAFLTEIVILLILVGACSGFIEALTIVGSLQKHIFQVLGFFVLINPHI